MTATKDYVAACLPKQHRKVHSFSREKTKILAQSAVRSFELRGRITTCVLRSVIGRTQALVGCYIRCLFDRFIMVRFQPCKMCRPMLFRTLIPVKCPFHVLPFYCPCTLIGAQSSKLVKAMNNPCSLPMRLRCLLSQRPTQSACRIR